MTYELMQLRNHNFKQPALQQEEVSEPFTVVDTVHALCSSPRLSGIREANAQHVDACAKPCL